MRVSRERRWKLISTGTGMLGGLIAKRLLRAGFAAVRNDSTADSPFDPTKPRFSWPEAMLWAVAAGIGLSIAKVVSTRVAVFGWEAVTGAPPPGTVEKVPAVA